MADETGARSWGRVEWPPTWRAAAGLAPCARWGQERR